MRITSFAAILFATLFVTSAASAQEPRASVEGFGGLGVGSFFAYQVAPYVASGALRVGLTSGASTPDNLVERAVRTLDGFANPD